MPPHGKKFANYWHGSFPVQDRRKAVSKIGKPAVEQWTAERHYALATVGINAYVTTEGDYGNTPYIADSRSYAWLERNRLIDRQEATRPGGSQILLRNADGDRVLAAWNTEHGEPDTTSAWGDFDERGWEGC